MMRTLSGKAVYPRQVHFSFPEPSDRTEYERILGCQVFFGQQRTVVIMDATISAIPVIHPDPGLLAYFEDYAKNVIRTLDSGQEVTRLATHAIVRHLDDKSLSIKKIARFMAMSVRTLQIRLKQEGTGFSPLLARIRYQLAMRYLREGYDVNQITWLLGFSDPSVFRKAFKAWSGLTPREYMEAFSRAAS
jgi:AraC-like DNA-binding protein